jgi:hypothetical protein
MGRHRPISVVQSECSAATKQPFVKLRISDLTGSDRVNSLGMQFRRCRCEYRASTFRSSTAQARDAAARLR